MGLERQKVSTNTLANISVSGGVPGPIGPAVGITDPQECLYLLLPDQFYNDLLVETNRYADQQRAQKNDTTPWKPIGINIAMGIISLPALDDYWSTDPILSHSWFHVIMSRNRFREILRFVHVVDNTTAPSHTDPGYRKLCKVRPLLKTLGKNCSRFVRTSPTGVN